MDSSMLQQICNVIVLVSAVIIAARNIYGFVKAPVDHISRASLRREEERIKAVLEQQIPELFNKQAESQNKVYQANFAELNEVIGSLQESLDEIKQITIENNKDLKGVQTTLSLLTSAQLDCLRYNMNCIYYKYRPYNSILSCDKKAFIKFYDDYHEMGGNTWIDALYTEVKDWHIVEDENELKLEK